MSPYRHFGGALAVCVGYWLLAKYSLSLPVKASGIQMEAPRKVISKSLLIMMAVWT